MAVCTAWVEMDVEPRVGSSLVAKFVLRANRRSLQLLLEDKLYFLTGWEIAEFNQDQAAPAELQLSSFKSCFPTASGHLALREDWLETIGNTIKGQTSKDAFDQLIKNHNGVWNPSGIAYSPLSRKRAAEAAEASKVEGFSVCENVNAYVFLHRCILYRFSIFLFRF